MDAGPSRQWAQCPGSCEGLCRFTLRTVFASLMEEGADCEALFALLGSALCADAPSTGSGTVLWRNE
ncbi:CrcB family protein [Actinomyces sp. oral taxon 178 str. F0338]|nr:CrcB family protein [Actinomyces sp. oral taxon 178 str. F0338]